MTTADNNSLRDEIRKVGSKVDALQGAHETDRSMLRQLHADHLLLANRVRLSEDHITKNQADLDKHIEVACVLQQETRERLSDIKDTLVHHIAEESRDRKEIILHMQGQSEKIKDRNLNTLLWLIGLAISVVGGLFGVLWATGNVVGG